MCSRNSKVAAKYFPNATPISLTNWLRARACLINHKEAAAIYSQVEKLLGSFDCNTIGATVYLYGRLKDLSSRSILYSFILSLSLLPTSMFSTKSMVIFLDCCNCSIKMG